MEWEAGRNFLMGQGIFYIIAGIGALGFLCILFQYILGRIFCGKAGKPRKRKTDYIGNLYETFEKQVKIKGNVNNVNNFVDNYLSTHKFGPISLVSLDWFCGQLVYLCLLCGILCGGLGYIWKVETQQCLRIVFLGAGTFGSLFCIRKITNYGARMKKARLNLTAYLEDDIMPGILNGKKMGNKAEQADGLGGRMGQAFFSGENQGQASFPEYKQGEASLLEGRRGQVLEKKESDNKENKKARRTARILEEVQNEKRRQESIEPVKAYEMDQDIEPVKVSGISRNIEPVKASGISRDIEPVKASGISRDIEPVKASGISQNIEPVKASGMNKDMDSDKDFEKGSSTRVGSQARLLVKMNEVREFAQKTMAEVDGEGREQKDTIMDAMQADREEEEKESFRETAATVIRPLERESTRKTSKALTEKEEKIIADILKEYAK